MEDIIIRPVYDRRKKASPFQDAVIDIEIRFSRTERKWLSTSVRVYSNQWEDGVIVRRPDAGSLNRKIQEQIKKYLMHGIKVEHTKKPNKALGN